MKRHVWIAAFIVAVLGIGSCSHIIPGGSTANPPVTQSLPATREQSASTYIYVADAGLKEIVAYSTATGKLVPNKTITLSSVPYDVAEDSSGTLYVSFLVASQIGVYRGGQLVRTISIEHPQALTVDDRGNLYVANGLKDWVSVFRPGASTPNRVITMTGRFWLYGGLAVRGDVLYADVTASAGGVVERCPLASAESRPCRITNGFGAYFGGVAFDAQGNMVVGGAGTFIWFSSPRWQQIAAHYIGKGDVIDYMTSDANGTVYAAVNGSNPYIAVIDGVGKVRTISGGLSHPLGVAVGL